MCGMMANYWFIEGLLKVSIIPIPITSRPEQSPHPTHTSMLYAFVCLHPGMHSLSSVL